MDKTKSFIKIDPRDNVAVAIEAVPAGASALGVTLLDDIPTGHKLALADIALGENVVKYGFPIGHATEAVAQGKHIHVHNLKTNLSGLLEYTYDPADIPVLPAKSGTFMGYKRADGGVGIRNEIWIVNTVGCVNRPAERIAAEANRRFAGRTDGVFTFVHPYGCSQLGDDHTHTQEVLAGLVKHPNAAGVLVLGLGCENNTIKSFREVLGAVDDRRVKFLTAQEADDEVEAALALIEELVAYAETCKREPVDIGKLVIGLKCGGSDGFSGITGNPLVGRMSDRVIQHGGISLLSEVPEMFGAETILMNRCGTEALFDQTVSLINDFKEYYMRYNQVVYENPSPGNKDGGISTLEDKSLGCTQKGGTQAVTAVLRYGDRAETPGLNLLQGPGNDIVACTALTAAGAHVILFTTGRGTPVGGPVPTIKIATNADLARRKANWTDFNAGMALEGTSMDDAADALWAKVLAVAEGREQTRNEENNYREIAIFKDGVTL